MIPFNTRKTIAYYRDSLVLLSSNELIEIQHDDTKYRMITGLNDAWCYCPTISSGTSIYLLSSPGVFKVNISNGNVTQPLDLISLS